VIVEIEGAAGGCWHLLRSERRWHLQAGPAAAAVAVVTLDEETAWRLLFKMLPEAEAARRIRVEGDAELGAAFLRARAVM
jgi:hypothetical protein